MMYATCTRVNQKKRNNPILLSVHFRCKHVRCFVWLIDISWIEYVERMKPSNHVEHDRMIFNHASVRSCTILYPILEQTPYGGCSKFFCPNRKVLERPPYTKSYTPKLTQNHPMLWALVTSPLRWYYWNQQGGLRWSTADIQISSMIFMIYIICHISYYDILW